MTPSFQRVSALLALSGALGAQEPVVEHYPDGAIRVRYEVDAEGRRHGTLTQFYANGDVAVRATYAAGELDGKSESFHPGGETSCVAVYRKGVRHGIWREFTATGERVLSASYRNGELHGRHETYHQSGARHTVGNYARGRLDGKFVETSDDGRWERTAQYDDGLLDGPVRIKSDRKTISRQVWKAGDLVDLDGTRPFPVAKDVLLEKVVAIQRPPADSIDVVADALASDRAAALRRLMAYRYLCGLPFQGMTLVSKWNELCDVAAEVCKRNGGLSHDPPKPLGMDDARYRLGHRGASRSNLSAGGGMLRSVDSYMNDSDPTNIDRVGHRRWCLNPAMAKTGFGQSGRYSAMWAMDTSGRAPGGMTAIHYPPRGYCPVDFFGRRHAWSIARLRGGRPKKAALRVEVRALDEHFLPEGDPLELDWLDVAGGSYAAGVWIVFRPVDVVVLPGRRYSVEVSVDGGKSVEYRYIVEFTEAAR